MASVARNAPSVSMLILMRSIVGLLLRWQYSTREAAADGVRCGIMPAI